MLPNFSLLRVGSDATAPPQTVVLPEIPDSIALNSSAEHRRVAAIALHSWHWDAVLSSVVASGLAGHLFSGGRSTLLLGVALFVDLRALLESVHVQV